MDDICEEIRNNIEQEGFADVGVGGEDHFGLSREKFDAAIAQLQQEGYELHSMQVTQRLTTNKITITMLLPPDSWT